MYLGKCPGVSDKRELQLIKHILIAFGANYEFYILTILALNPFFE